MSKRRHVHGSRVPPKFIEVSAEEMEVILTKARASLTPEEHAKLSASVMTTVILTEEIKRKTASIRRLRDMLFGTATEKTRKVVGASADDARPLPSSIGEPSKEKPRGHGRNGAAAYNGAKKVDVPHPSLKSGDPCPACGTGKLYLFGERAVLVRITGAAPLAGEVFSLEQLRCNPCGALFTAPAPEGVGPDKYDETATAMIGLLKYGVGLPFNRIEKLQAGFGIPMPATTQWDLVRDGAPALTPVVDELARQAAQAKVLHNDDTTMKVLELTGDQRAAAAADDETNARTGVFTSGIVATDEGQKIALFFTGAKHAGENLADVLARRANELPPPIQMCDALSRNTTGDFDTIVANCLAHARRKVVEVVEEFPDECRFVLELLREVYKTDATARARGLSPDERLQLHQSESAPRMAQLEQWMREQFEERRVEPNSGLGRAIRYMQRHWSELTLFLRAPGAPLDNNICERVLKKAILHRKNSLFYKSTNGARVGDVFMSLIHTAELNKVEPFEYLVALLRHRDDVAADPGDWMPWNYRATLAELSSSSSPAS